MLRASVTLLVFLAILGGGNSSSLRTNSQFHKHVVEKQKVLQSADLGVTSITTETTNAFCMQVDVAPWPAYPFLQLVGGLEGSVSLEKDSKTKGQYKCGAKLTVSAGLQINGLVLNAGFYFSGSIGIENKVVTTNKPYEAALLAIQEFFVTLWKQSIGKYAQAAGVQSFTKRLGIYALEIQESFKKKMNFNDEQTRREMKSQATEFVLEYRDRMAKLGPQIKTELAKKSYTDEKAWKSWKMANFMAFREKFYGKEIDLAYLYHTERWWTWSAPDCAAVGKQHLYAFRKVICVLMSGGLLLEEPKVGFKAWAMPFSDWKLGFKPKIGPGNENTFNSMPELFPELFFQMDPVTNKRGAQKTKAQILEMIDKIISASKPATQKPDVPEFYTDKQLAMMTYQYIREIITSNPDKVIDGITTMRDAEFPKTCKEPTATQIVTTGRFGATFGSSTIGFCTPDTNLLQVEGGWKTTYEQQTDCAFKKTSREWSVDFTIAIGPVVAFHLTRGPQGWEGEARFRLLMAEKEASPDPEPPEEYLNFFGKTVSDGLGNACKALNNVLKVDSLANIGSAGPRIADAIKLLFTGIADSVAKRAAAKDANSSMMKKIKSGVVDMLPSIISSGLGMAVKEGLRKLLPGGFQSNIFMGFNVNYKYDDKLKKKVFGFELASETATGIEANAGAAKLQFWKTSGTVHAWKREAA